LFGGNIVVLTQMVVVLITQLKYSKNNTFQYSNSSDKI